MVSSQGKLADSKAANQSARFASQTERDGLRDLNTEQMFRLVDSMLSFEACLYHQVLPLALEGSRLKLGMVNPEDTTAVDYVNRILYYMNCSLVRQPITAETHQAMLSAYLNYTGTSKSETERVRKPLGSASATRTSDKVASASKQHQPLPAASSPQVETAEVDSNDVSTFILTETEASNDQKSEADVQSSWLPIADEVLETQTDALESPVVAAAERVTPGVPKVPAASNNLPVLEVQAVNQSSPVDVLATLQPKDLLRELLGRVLAGGIGRLYFERQRQQGRILWSQNGVLQSVLEGLSLPVFQGVVDELKQLTHLDLTPVQEPKQVEVERLYEQNRLLLRLRVMPGAYGEEATLQVLRGAALKFYQQQQLTHLSRDALGIAQQLQRKLNELRERVQLNPSLNTGQLEALPALNQLLESVDQQLEALRQLQSQE